MDSNKEEIDYEKPLSPILNNNKINRKILIKRRIHNKARVKLANKFEDLEQQSEKIEEKDDVTAELTSKVYRTDSLPSKNETPKEEHVTAVEESENDNFCFKIPSSPAPSMKKCVKSENPEIHHARKAQLTINKSVTPASKTGGFQTAGGKGIYISEKKVAESSKLFDDILKPESSVEVKRTNKCSFLEKSTKQVQTVENASPLKRGFIQSDSYKGKSLNPIEDIKETKENDFESFTQVIDESGITNTQINSACENILNSTVFQSVQSCNNKSSFSFAKEKELFRDAKLALESASKSCQKLPCDISKDFKGFDEGQKRTATQISKNVNATLHYLLQDIHNVLNSEKNKKSQKTIFSITDHGGEAAKDASIKNLETQSSMESQAYLRSPPPKRIKHINYNDFTDSEATITNLKTCSVGRVAESFEVDTTQLDNLSLKGNISYHEKHTDEVNKKSTSSLDYISCALKTNASIIGFKTALGNKINVSKDALTKAYKSYEDNSKECDTLISVNDNLQKPILKSDKQTEVTSNYLRQVSSCMSVGFKTAGGGDISVKNESLKSVKEKFRDVLGSIKEECALPDSDASIDQNSLTNSRGVNTSFLNINDALSNKVNTAVAAFRTASYKDMKSTKNALQNAETIIDNDIRVVKNISNVSKHTEMLSVSKESEDELKAKAMKPTAVSNRLHTKVFQNSRPSINNSAAQSKRRLGVASCKPISLSEDQLQRAKMLFQDDFPLALVSPVRPNIKPLQRVTQGQILHSTPVKGSPLQVGTSTLIDTTITPIKVSSDESELDSFKPLLEDCQIYTNSPLLIQKQTEGNVETWLKDATHEKELLMKKLDMIVERCKTLERQQICLDGAPTEHISQRHGTLTQRKSRRPRMTLTMLVQNRRPGDVKSNTISRRLMEINPQNADYIHFNCLFGNNVEAVIKTDDGAVIVPNTRNLIGISEVEVSFRTMPGVRADLIPKGWIRNHFKWIVWKLASYERQFPEECAGCFSLENILQQLKYRYDREIDKVERSCLRKIFEKDDAPQKSMVLCVSNIIKLNENNYELELTDGWYSIRTIIDEAMSQQVACDRIQVGTKLITCGADLLNCDACYPLEATDLAYLKICYNSTRRARWYSKLGYQHVPAPFPVPIESIHPLGGNVGCIKVHVVRVYPLRYMERLDNNTVWRNKKSEERRCQEWENEQLKKLEQLQETVRTEVLSCEDLGSIRNIKCPKTLHRILQNSHNSEYVENLLSETQKNELRAYQQKLSTSKQNESSRITESLCKLRQAKRDVSPILRVVVVDIYKCYSDVGLTLHVWNPTESHLQMIKEGKDFYIYNVTPKRNGDLGTSAKTKFEYIPNISKPPDILQRVMLPIAEINCQKLFLNEFDTVGIVVQINVNITSQELWLADANQRLLYIKVVEGPKTCLLFDSLKKGQTICCSNLVLCDSRGEVGQAMANHFTVFSSYPQHKHLQEGLASFQKQMPKDLNAFLISCDNIIDEYKTSPHSSNKTSNSSRTCDYSTMLDDSIEEGTLVYSRITSTDIAMSLIDIDQFK